MSHCCSPPSNPTTQHFDAQRAARDLATYQKSGPDPTTLGLLAGLAGTGIRPESLLDIGAGIGALSFELLKTGVARATCVDMSQAFVEGGQAETQRRGLAARMSWRVADFLALAPSVPPADVVTLDRVVCCYPAVEPLLRQAAQHARVLLAMSYPRDRWYVRLVLAAENFVRQLRRNAFQSFVHPVADMEALLTDAGFQRVSGTGTLVWRMDVFRRVAT
jgi:magnesium-protoporphyrin O-methyltransferase